MKKNINFYLTIICLLSFNTFAQKGHSLQANTKIKKTQTMRPNLLENQINTTKTIKQYHVEERINMTFGGYITTYTVTDSSLIRTNNLGPNNSRVITIQYVKVPQRGNNNAKTIVDTMPPNTVIDTVQNHPQQSTNLSITDTLAHHGDFAYIYMIKTYERIAEKGYKSVEMFQKLGNAYYYNSQMDKAAKWYEKLFSMTNNLEPEYFYRYANSLKAIGAHDKADQIMKKYNQLTEKNSR